jgi:hypothetical protein
LLAATANQRRNGEVAVADGWARAVWHPNC